MAVRILAAVSVNRLLLRVPEKTSADIAEWGGLLFYLLFCCSTICFLATGPLASVRAASSLGTCLSAASVCVVLALYGSLQLSSVRRLEYVIDSVIILLIALYTVRNDSSYFDYSIIVGPINDIIHGKDIGINLVSIYGILNLYVAAAIFKLFNVTDYFAGLSYLISACYFCGYTTIYLFLRVHTSNILLSLLALIYIININFSYSPIPSHWLPQVGLFRFGVFLPVFLVLYAMDRFRNKPVVEWLVAFPVALIVFWLPELGVYILVSLTAVFSYRHVMLRTETRLTFYLKISSCVLMVVVLKVIYIYLKYHQMPIWGDYTYFQKIFARYGIAMFQFGSIGVWFLPACIYLVCLYVCLTQYPRIKHADAWLFLAFFGLQSMLYFAGKQGIYDLPRIILPAAILAVVALHHLMTSSTALAIFPHRAVLPVFCYLVISFSVAVSWDIAFAANRKDVWPLAVSARFRVLARGTTEPWAKSFIGSKELYGKFREDVSVIQRLVPAGEPIALLSKTDTLFYAEAGRGALFKNPVYSNTFLIKEVQEMTDTVLRQNCTYLFVDNSNFQVFSNVVSEHIWLVLLGLQGHYQRVASLNFLDVYKRIGSR